VAGSTLCSHPVFRAAREISSAYDYIGVLYFGGGVVVLRLTRLQHRQTIKTATRPLLLWRPSRNNPDRPLLRPPHEWGAPNAPKYFDSDSYGVVGSPHTATGAVRCSGLEYFHLWNYVSDDT